MGLLHTWKEPAEIGEIMPDVSAVIVAAGNSTRMGGDISKQFLELDGMPVLAWTLRAFECASCVRETVIAAREEDIRSIYGLIQTYGFRKVTHIVKGGSTRQESVAAAAVQTVSEAEYLAIHDGARPLITAHEIETAAEMARIHGAAAIGVPVKDTIKRVETDGKIVDTPERALLWAVQTPQVFRREQYLTVMEQLGERARALTDDCQLMEMAGIPVYMARGSYDNLKITTPEDLPVAQAILRTRGEE